MYLRMLHVEKAKYHKEFTNITGIMTDISCCETDANSHQTIVFVDVILSSILFSLEYNM